MDAPTVTDNYFTEREGVLAVARKINTLRFVWRETPNADVGLDGQIEHVHEDGRATGRLVAVQVKSGASYLRRSGDDFVYYPSTRHAEYWRHFPIPVLLFLHDPSTGETYWADARRQLAGPDRAAAVRVPLSSRLTIAQRDQLFASYGPISNTPLSSHELAADLSRILLPTNPAISGVDLFLAGMTDIATKLFFDMSLIFDLLDILDVDAYSSGPLHTFIDAYIAFLFAYSLTRYDYTQYLTDVDRQLQPVFVAPLTPKGLELRDYLYALGVKYAPHGIGVTEERMLTMVRNNREQLRFPAVNAMAADLRR